LIAQQALVDLDQRAEPVGQVIGVGRQCAGARGWRRHRAVRSARAQRPVVARHRLPDTLLERPRFTALGASRDSDIGGNRDRKREHQAETRRAAICHSPSFGTVRSASSVLPRFERRDATKPETRLSTASAAERVELRRLHFIIRVSIRTQPTARGNAYWVQLEAGLL
jgi:hypothetical protein